MTTTALWLCLHLFLHFRQRLLYVRLPVSGFMKKSHSCFARFDNFAIIKTPFTHCTKSIDLDTQIGCFREKFFKKISPSLIWTKGTEMHTLNRRFNIEFFEKYFYPSTCLNWERLKFRVLDEKICKKIKSLVS